MRWLTVLAFSAVTLPVSIPASEADSEAEVERIHLSVEEAVVTALEHNRSLQVQRLEPAIAGTFEELERAEFDPYIFADLSYSRERAQRVSRETGQPEPFSFIGEDIRAGVGAGVRLPTGTDLEVAVDHFHTESDRTPEQHTARVGLNLTQALLRGRGHEVNLVNIRQARLDTLASQFELRGFTESFVAEVEEAYWDLLLAQRQERIFERSLEVAREQREVTEERIEVGQLPATERPAVEAEEALRRQALIDARNLRAQYRLQLFSLMMPTRAVANWDTDLELADLPDLPDWELAEVDEHVELAYRWRPELEESRLRLERQELEVVQTRNGLLPRLDLFVTLGKSGYADSFGTAYQNLSDRGYDATVGVRFEHAWGNRQGRSIHRRAGFIRQQAEEALRNLEHLVELDVRLALNEVERARQQVEASAATRRLQEEVLRTEEERFRVGRSTVLQVSQAQRDLLASQIAEVEAVVDVRKALIRLHRLDGTLLRRRGIDL